MRTYALPIDEPRLEAAPRAVALGLFDGVHLGHRRVLSATVGHKGLRACALTFGDKAAALKPDAAALCSEAQTAHLFEVLGLDEWLQMDFDAVRELSPEDFVDKVLVARLSATLVCCGEDFRFGKDGRGDTALLRSLCDRAGIALSVSAPLCDGTEPISSRRIRRLIETGEVREATRLLGHPFAVDTPVMHGQALGRTLDFPTVNQPLPARFVKPRFGVYTSTVVIDGTTYYGITNIGVRPTVGADAPLCETWVEGYDGDLYDRALSVVLTGFLREERRFPSVDALKEQLLADREEARRRRDNGRRAVLFDFDDTLQNRPAAFHRYAVYFLSTYAPHLTGEAFDDALRVIKALNNSGYVDYIRFFTEMPKAVGVTAPPPAEVLFKEYQRIFPTYVQLFDGARDTLEALRAKGYLLGIVTNGPLVQQHRKLDVSGLRPLLDTVAVSTEEAVAKPDTELFLRAAARLGLAPSQCVFVGDHPQNDIDGALTAGMQAIFLHTRLPSCDHPAIPSLSTVSEILTLL
ncbi:MAG: riboflavin biosynthesis protein RibF [Clostridia bacterium]|nr:riboflavin biosynthesis protein RibF [Clostridia bacterium]